MNSWNIIKDELTKESKPKSFGRQIALNKCADLFLKLRGNLIDEVVATEALNTDDELRSALMDRAGIKELRKAGVIL